MLECFIDYVGFKTCLGAYGAAPSGLYLTQLPGVTFDKVEKVADDQQRTWEGVYDDVQHLSLNKFYRDLKVKLASCYDLNKDCDLENDIFCDEDNMIILSNAWLYLLGINMMEQIEFSPRLNRYTTIDKKQAGELKALFQIEYDKALTEAIAVIDVTPCEFCCGGNPETVTYLP